MSAPQPVHRDDDDAKSLNKGDGGGFTTVEAVENAYTNGEVNEYGDPIDPEYFKLSHGMKFARSVLLQMILFGA